MKKTILIVIIAFISSYSFSQTTTLLGSGTDVDGTISSYSWRKISGPAGGVITSPAAAVTTVTGLLAGIYQYELTVTDNQGGVGMDTVQITVIPGNVKPKANAGPDQIITLPSTGFKPKVQDNDMADIFDKR